MSDQSEVLGPCFVLYRHFSFIEADNLDPYDESGYDMKDIIKIIPFANQVDARAFIEHRNSAEYKAQKEQEASEKYLQKIAEINALNEKIQKEFDEKMNERRRKGWKVTKTRPTLHKMPFESRIHIGNCRETYEIINQLPDGSYEVSFVDQITNGHFGGRGP